MAQVTELTIHPQQGSSSAYYATWKFTAPDLTATSDLIKKGMAVTIKSGSTWYNGASIQSWVYNHRWIVSRVSGKRVTLGKNINGTQTLNTSININNLLVSGSGGNTDIGNTLDHYEVHWFYDSGDGVWFDGGESTTELTNSIYNAPDNALSIKVTVKPISKTYTVDNEETDYWTGTDVTVKYYISSAPPETPSTPTVEIDGFKLIASLENITDGRADQIQFDVFKGNTRVKIGVAEVLTSRASFEFTISAGSDYRVRAAAINLYGESKLYSDWSAYTSPVGTQPSVPANITSCRAGSSTSVILEWTGVDNAETYDIEYATNREYFDVTGDTESITGIATTRYTVTGLESGSEYFFRVRAVNENGESGWCGIKSVVIGRPPSAPTTWSSTTTAIVGEPLYLYWIHNSEDESSQVKAEIEVYYNDVKQTYTVNNPYLDEEEEEDRDKTLYYTIDTTQYTEGTTIKWRVRTCGVTEVYGDWSVQRTVDIYAPVVAELTITNTAGSVIDTLTSYPLNIKCTATPVTQEPIGYHVSIYPNTTYETVDFVGNRVTINEHQEIFSKYYDINTDLNISLSAGDIDLANNISYTVECIVSMNSGLTGTATATFEVDWTESTYLIEASVIIDKEAYTAYIGPYCLEDKTGDLLMSVYRKEYDGTFTEIATNIGNSRNSWVTDPHPALDYARYRVVGRSQTTGAVSYYDVPAQPVKCNSIIIQWDEEWSDFNVTEEDSMEERPWTGSMLKIPYNIDVSDSNTPDVSLVEYIGRKNPVSYYGTQVGTTSTWSVEIPKSDKETLYALRRLAIWMGDVYVREPSGSGYWANVTLSFSQTHLSVTIPVTFNIKRVEGGI